MSQIPAQLRSRSTAVLFVTFALVIILAIVGTAMSAIWRVNHDLFLEAMRIIGVSGPVGTGIQSATDAIISNKKQTSDGEDWSKK